MTAKMHRQRKVTRSRYEPRFSRQRRITRGGPILPGTGGLPAISLVAPSPTVMSAGSRLFTATGTSILNVAITVRYVSAAGVPGSVAGAYVSATSFTFTLPAGAITVAGTVPWSADFAAVTGIIGPSIVVTAAAVLEFDVNGSTIVQIQEWVDDHPEMADEVLDVEQAGQARVTLISWLEGFIEHRDGPDE